jgi:hypothetical protein
MDFKTFFEAPYSGNLPPEHREMKCPKGHEFDPTKEEYFFDFAGEEVSTEWHDEMNRKVGMMGNFKGIIPMACKEHGEVFIYDLDSKTSRYPKNEEEEQMCVKMIVGLLSKKNKLTPEVEEILKSKLKESQLRKSA